ncbi:hypothetical protein [Streptomyces sp. NPDC058739]|uniref:hypothetical protein n=1 Tax=Streptomyces sp. NPDC058739 TaxID=3346618 RepID=UPI0036C1C7AD
MSGTGGDGTGGPEIGSVRFNDRGQIEYYDGEVWGLYPDLPTGGDMEERAVVRDPGPVNPGGTPTEPDGGGPTHPEPR